MAFNLSSITAEPTLLPPRIVLCGIPKIGKTTFGSQSPGALLVPIKGERGADEIAVPKTPVQSGFGGVMEIIGALYEERHDFQTLVIDSISTLESLIWDRLIKSEKSAKIQRIEDFGYGKGYVNALNLWRQMLSGLDALRESRGIGSILISHVAVKSFQDPLGTPFDQYVLSVHKGAAELVQRWADCILFANARVHVTQETDARGAPKLGARKRGITVDERVLFTQARAGHPGGGRGAYGHIPYELPLDYQSFADAVSAARTTL